MLNQRLDLEVRSGYLTVIPSGNILTSYMIFALEITFAQNWQVRQNIFSKTCLNNCSFVFYSKSMTHGS